MSKLLTALEALGKSVDELQSNEDELVRQGRAHVKVETDKRICICGHAVSRHTNGEGEVDDYCTPSSIICPCKHIRSVLTTQDTRLFLMKTLGSGMSHALLRGLLLAEKKKKESLWAVELKCDKCQGAENVLPTPITREGTAIKEVTTHSNWVDVFMCAECRNERS